MSQNMKAVSAVEWARELIGVLAEQKALVEELAPLAERQGDLIERGATEGLLELLTERQQVIDRLSGADQALSALTADLGNRWTAMGLEARQRVHELASAIERTLAAVLARDEADGQRLVAAREVCRRQLAGLDASRHARSAYVGQKAAASRFADRRG